VSSHFELTAKAVEDLREIWSFIALENCNPSAADRLWSDIEEACGRLAAMPTLGHARSELITDPEIRFYCVRNYYLVIYLKNTAPLQIVRVLQGARDVEAELGDS